MLNIQASNGSFNHLAVMKLYGDCNSLELNFCGSPLNTFCQAEQNKAEAFVALRNDLVMGNLIDATVQACKVFQIRKVSGVARLPINMCLLRTVEAVEENVPLAKIASHPAALAQVTAWKDKQNLTEIEDPAGTSEAAQKLATNYFSSNTGVIGSAFLATLYPDLVITEEQIQDSNDNTTLFGQLAVSRRESPISGTDARKELQATIEIAERHLGGASTCFI